MDREIEHVMEPIMRSPIDDYSLSRIARMALSRLLTVTAIAIPVVIALHIVAPPVTQHVWMQFMAGSNPTLQGTFRTQDLLVDNTATIDNTINVGVLTGSNAGTMQLGNGVNQITFFQDSMIGGHDSTTSIGGLVPFSNTDTGLPNFGTFQGQGLTQFKYPVGFNGQSAPLYTIDVLSDEHMMTAEDIKIRIGWAGGYDTTAGPITSRNILSAANAQKNAGSNPLTNVAIYGDATNGDDNIALWTERGRVRVDGNATLGIDPALNTLAVNGMTTMTGTSTTTAKPSVSGTVLEVASGGSHNYVNFRSPDATDAGIVFNNTINDGDGYVTYRRSVGMEFGVSNATAFTINSAISTLTSPLRVGGELLLGGSTAPLWTFGLGSPNGVVTAPPGSLYSRTDSGLFDSTVYEKVTGSGNTGWQAFGAGDSGPGPTIGAGCGTGATATAGLSHFTMTAGTSPGACVLTLSSSLLSATPTCVVSSRNATPVPYDANATTITIPSGLVAGQLYDVSCTDHP